MFAIVSTFTTFNQTQFLEKKQTEFLIKFNGI